MTPLSKEIKRRRTFSIISYSDAGKTTLTEKQSLVGGRQLSVKNRRAAATKPTIN